MGRTSLGQMKLPVGGGGNGGEFELTGRGSDDGEGAFGDRVGFPFCCAPQARQPIVRQKSNGNIQSLEALQNVLTILFCESGGGKQHLVWQPQVGLGGKVGNRRRGRDRRG